MEAIGKRHIIVYAWILWEDRDTISAWMLGKDWGIRWAEECFFISYHTTRSSMWEWTSFSHREFCTTNCMYPWPWMHKSYGLSKSRWSFLQICWHIPTVVFGMKFNQQVQDSFCKFSTIQVRWEACDIHVWYWIDEGDVPLLMSLPPMRNLGFQFELTPEEAYVFLCTYWHEKNGLEDSH